MVKNSPLSSILDKIISVIKAIISSGVYCSPAVSAEMSAHLRFMCSSKVVISELLKGVKSISLHF